MITSEFVVTTEIHFPSSIFDVKIKVFSFVTCQTKIVLVEKWNTSILFWCQTNPLQCAFCDCDVENYLFKYTKNLYCKMFEYTTDNVLYCTRKISLTSQKILKQTLF